MSAIIPRQATRNTSTFIDPTESRWEATAMTRKIHFFLLLLLISSHGIASAADDKALLLKKADEALARSDRKTADFFAARYLGLCSHEKPEACPPEALEPFLKKRRLGPKAFIPGSWDPSFLDWFENSVRDRWGVAPERIREKARSFEITSGTYQGKYAVTVVAYPELELWHVLKDGFANRPMVLAMGAFRDHPTVFFGKVLSGTSAQVSPTFLDTQKRTLHYFWKPDFYDLDRDGTPEIWLRFNLAWGNGFSQVLEVYKIRTNGKLELLHHFQCGANGYARRLEDGSVEMGGQMRPASETYHTETWQFESKDFKKTAEKDLPIPKDQDWPLAVSRT